MNSILYLSKRFDFFGVSYSLSEHGAKAFKTSLGFILSAIVTFSTICFAFITGQELFLKTTPFVNTFQEINYHNAFNISTMPIIIAVGYEDGPFVQNISSVYNISINYHQTINGDSSLHKTYNMSDCDPYKYPTEISRLMIEELNNYKAQKADTLCINIPNGLRIQNQFGTLNSSYIGIQFDLCDPNITSCNPDISILQQVNFVKISFVDTLLNPNDFENPIVSYFNQVIQQVGVGLYKRVYLSISNNTLESDNGFLFNSNNRIDYTSVISDKIDLNIPEEREVLIITIDAPNKRNHIKRSYIKVQNVMANVGGIFKTTIMILKVFLGNYVSFKYHQEIEKLSIKKNQSTTVKVLDNLSPSIEDKSNRKINVIDIQLDYVKGNKVIADGLENQIARINQKSPVEALSEKIIYQK